MSWVLQDHRGGRAPELRLREVSKNSQSILMLDLSFKGLLRIANGKRRLQEQGILDRLEYTSRHVFKVRETVLYSGSFYVVWYSCWVMYF